MNSPALASTHSLDPRTSMPNLRSSNTNTERIETLLHQLRNPLTALSTFAKLLDKRGHPDDPNRWIVERIERECQHMQLLIDRYEGEGGFPSLPTQSQPLPQQSLPTFLQELWPNYETLARDHGIHASLEIDPVCETIDMRHNSLGLREAIDNLMDNAIKYTPPGGTVTLTAQVEGDTIALQVRDTGPGVAAADLARIFERHYRVDGSQPGQGLGLTIARDLVAQMGGEVTVESNLGRGTEFTIRLPR